MKQATVTGEFVAGGNGAVFVLLRRSGAAPRGCVLVVPPFAEEMNKSRRMITEVALGLVNDGVSVVLPDLFGTGDSCGDFAEADWATWVADLSAATTWSAAQGCPVNGILAIRLGCALAEVAISSGAVPPVQRTVLWQPVFDGGRYLSQFLRLRVAASLMEDSRETLAGLRAHLGAGEALEVAGYTLSSRLAEDLDAVKPPQCLPAEFGVVSWLELVRQADAPLPSPSISLIERTRNLGASVHSAALVGEPFWSSTEIVVNPEVVQRTVSSLNMRDSGEVATSG